MRLLRVFSVNSAWKAREGHQLPPLGVPGAVPSPAGTGEEEEEAGSPRAERHRGLPSSSAAPGLFAARPPQVDLCSARAPGWRRGRSLVLLPAGFVALGEPGRWRLPWARRLTGRVTVVWALPVRGEQRAAGCSRTRRS